MKGLREIKDKRSKSVGPNIKFNFKIKKAQIEEKIQKENNSNTKELNIIKQKEKLINDLKKKINELDKKNSDKNNESILLNNKIVELNDSLKYYKNLIEKKENLIKQLKIDNKNANSKIKEQTNIKTSFVV